MNAAAKAKKGKTPEATNAFVCLQDELLFQFGSRSPRGDTLLDDSRTLLLSPSTALEFAFKKDEYSMRMLSKVNTAFKTPVSLYLFLSKHPASHDTEPASQMANEFSDTKIAVRATFRPSHHSPSVSCLLSQFLCIQNLVTEERDISTTISELIRRFTLYREQSEGRITLRQNPHFYHGLPDEAAGYGRNFQIHSIKDAAYIFHRKIETLFVLVDKPAARLFLDTHRPRIFGNLWRPDRSIILKGEYTSRFIVDFN